MKRLYNDIHDISVDVPAAYTLLDTLANKLHSKHVLGDNLMTELPSRLPPIIFACNYYYYESCFLPTPLHAWIGSVDKTLEKN